MDMPARNLLEAVRCNNVEEALMFLNTGSPTTWIDEHKCTPLHYAVLNKNFKLISALIEKGADPLMPEFGRTPVTFASDKLLEAVRFNRTADALAWMDSIALTTSIGVHGYTPLHYAVFNNNFELINALIKKGAKPLAPDGYGRTPVRFASGKLLEAVRSNRTADALAWMNSIALTTSTDEYGNTPLHHAVINGNFALIKELTDKGANQHAPNNRGQTPASLASDKLLEAVRFNRTADALAWMDSIALTTSIGMNGYTPLHYAVSNQNSALIYALIQRGANPLAQDARGRRPKLDREVLRRAQELASLQEPLFDAVRQAVNENDEHTAIALAYLDEGVIPLYCQQDTLRTALHWAAINNNMILFARMKSAANILAKDASGRTPSGVLISQQKLEMLGVLVSLPRCALEIIIDFNDNNTELDDAFFFSQSKKRTADILKCLKVPAESTELQELKKDLEKPQSTSLLTVPQMLSKLDGFLDENKNMGALLILPLDGFIKELRKDVNFDACPAITNYLRIRQSILPRCVRDFKKLYQRMRSNDRRFHAGEGFLRGKENLSDEQFLEKLAAYINNSTQGQTAACWEIVCKYQNETDQIRELNKIMSTRFKPAFSFLRKPVQYTQESDEHKIEEGWVLVPESAGEKQPRDVTRLFAPQPPEANDNKHLHPVVQRCRYPLS